MPKTANVFIPDYPEIQNLAKETYKYRVELYNKDADVFEPVAWENDTHAASSIAFALHSLITHDLLTDKDGEPYDNALVIDNKTDKTITFY